MEHPGKRSSLRDVLVSLDNKNGRWVAITFLFGCVLAITPYSLTLLGYDLGRSMGVALLCISGLLFVVACVLLWSAHRLLFCIVAIVAIGLSIFVWKHPLSTGPKAYPWLLTTNWLNDNSGAVGAIGISMQVRGYPETSVYSLAGSYLEHLHFTVTTPISVDPETAGWVSCIVSEVNSETWNNDDGSKVLASINLIGRVTVLEVMASAKTGNWNGHIFLHRNGSVIDSEAYERGHFSARDAMSIVEKYKNGKRTITDWPIAEDVLTKTMLLSIGIPERRLTKGEALSVCPSGRWIGQVQLRNETSGTIHLPN